MGEAFSREDIRGMVARIVARPPEAGELQIVTDTSDFFRLEAGDVLLRLRSPQLSCPSIAECILEEFEQSEYATIVVGRQGLSRKEEFLFGSVSSKIVGHARNCAVWVVA